MMMTHEQAAQAVKLLRSVASDIESMRSKGDYFGGFSESFTDFRTDITHVEWPNLSIMGHDITAFLKTVEDSSHDL